ncbi:MAG: hypothetical protein K2I06_02190 [Ruminococcus sp.]|nr:hypothetical protein [Ruminococcus sp.]
MSIINIHESVPVNIGDVVLYCEKFRASGIKNYSEQNTVSGDVTITNSGKKAIRLTFSGRIYNENNPIGFLVDINNLMKNDYTFSIEYKNVIFGECRVQSFVTDDNNDDFISATVTVISTEADMKNEESE